MSGEQATQKARRKKQPKQGHRALGENKGQTKGSMENSRADVMTTDFKIASSSSVLSVQINSKGINRKSSSTEQQNTRKSKAQYQPKSDTSVPKDAPNLKRIQNIPKPQRKFTLPVDNSNTPFSSILKYKHNARVPLEHPTSYDQEDASLDHPYRFEITHLEYPAHVRKSGSETPFKDLKETRLTMVESEAELERLANLLNHESEIAVDTEVPFL